MISKFAIVQATALLASLASSHVQAQATNEAEKGAAVRAVLAKYRVAIEGKDLKPTLSLFATDSQVFESGGSEGTYANYMAHHLGPELAEFKSFRFSDYKVDVRFVGPTAISTETYRYTIDPKTGPTVERKGVQTGVLRQSDGKWQIVSLHSSSRKPK